VYKTHLARHFFFIYRHCGFFNHRLNFTQPCKFPVKFNIAVREVYKQFTENQMQFECYLKLCILLFQANYPRTQSVRLENSKPFYHLLYCNCRGSCPGSKCEQYPSKRRRDCLSAVEIYSWPLYCCYSRPGAE
jgi:hypothetical protein